MANRGQSGVVYLVGAGPGDPGLISWKGIQCLRQADLVLYDYLANAELLREVRRDAQCVCLGQHGRSKIWSQEEIQQRMIHAAQHGLCVVRLKGGDPGVFGRLTEEIAALEEAKIDYQIVPGITAALAATAYAGIPLTDRHHASAVAFVTGQEMAGKPGSALDFEALANFPGTLVIYMGVTTAAEWVGRLIEAGKPPDTPVAIIRHVSLASQKIVRCRLDEVPDRVENGGPGGNRIRPPVLFICGPVVARFPGPSWFERLPLLGQTVLVTRPQNGPDDLANRLAQLGARVVRQPVISISPPTDWSEVDQAIAQLDQWDWLVFSSANGVESFLDRLIEQGWDMRRLASVRLAVIGPGTAAALERYRVRADVIPETFRAEALADALRPHAPGARILLARANRGRDVLPRMLSEFGAHVQQLVVYRSEDVKQLDPEVLAGFQSREIHWVTVTSSAIARSLVALAGEWLSAVRLASLSPVTSEALRECGYTPACEAKVYTMEGLVQAMVEGLGIRD